MAGKAGWWIRRVFGPKVTQRRGGNDHSPLSAAAAFCSWPGVDQVQHQGLFVIVEAGAAIFAHLADQIQ